MGGAKRRRSHQEPLQTPEDVALLDLDDIAVRRLSRDSCNVKDVQIDEVSPDDDFGGSRKQRRKKERSQRRRSFGDHVAFASEPLSREDEEDGWQVVERRRSSGTRSDSMSTTDSGVHSSTAEAAEPKKPAAGLADQAAATMDKAKSVVEGKRRPDCLTSVMQLLHNVLAAFCSIG